MDPPDASPHAAAKPTARPTPGSPSDPVRRFLWDLGNGTNEEALCGALEDLWRMGCPLADVLDKEICVDLKSAYAARRSPQAFMFGEEGTFLYLTACLVAVLTAASVIKARKWIHVPDSAVTIAVGWITGALVVVSKPPNSHVRNNTFSDSLFFDVLLPFIIFEAGYNMDRLEMRKRFSLVSLLPVVGTLASFALLAGLMLVPSPPLDPAPHPLDAALSTDSFR